MTTVQCIREKATIPTYGLGAPEKNPMFFENRVYQGSCGKVYPVPFIDKVYDDARPKEYDTVRLENDFVRLVLMPEIGGRIFIAQDKSNDDYDFFYRQDVIKPALVGLAGPWISGGVEFNWPQHHRPGTFMPADVHVEQEPDGSYTVWMSEHDPLNRLKGMHGIRLRPGSALVELRAQLYNRTPFTQTFLWWANVAARVHDAYQSFFPPDVHYVADHAVRAQSTFPIANNDYYGVDYAARQGANDLTRYRNIPVPTSYMVCETEFGFFGGYDFDKQGGFVHVANRHISPGKKQWTWGNHEFGWAWDRELTDNNGPYVELMAGVFTDNQPDFSYLHPYETKTFSQFWWPYQSVGPVQNATEDAAVRVVVEVDGGIDLGVVVSREVSDAQIVLREGDRQVLKESLTLSPGGPWKNSSCRLGGENPNDLHFAVYDAKGRLLVEYRPPQKGDSPRKRAVATEPPAPQETETIEQLNLTAEHLDQYRHPTRYPEPYWQEALRRDPQDARANIAWGRRKLSQGSFGEAESHLRAAVERLTERHPNPCTGEAYYYLGTVCRIRGKDSDAYAALYKAAWDYSWRSAAYYQLATIDCSRGDFKKAILHCNESLETNQKLNKAHIVKALALTELGEDPRETLSDLLQRDPLDHWARYESGDIQGFLERSRNDAQTVLDIVYDYADCGCYRQAAELLQLHCEHENSEVAVPNPLERSQLTRYVLAWLQDAIETGSGAPTLIAAREQSADYFFPSRVHDQIVLQWALEQDPADANAAFGLGNYLFDRKRHSEAIAQWETSRANAPAHPTVCRNLGIAYWNIQRDPGKARQAYLQALENDPADPRLFYEYDQLRKKIGDPVQDRLDDLLSRPDLVSERDDCSVELASLYNQTDQPEKALELLSDRRFHPWEGGEGQVLRQYTSARLLLGQSALKSGRAAEALEHFQLAMSPPQNLGEAYHLLQAKADVNYWTGKALQSIGQESQANGLFEASAAEAGDFQAMAVTEHSELSYYRGLALIELGRISDAEALFDDLRQFAVREMAEQAQIDYFATSLPLLLVFEDDLDEVKHQAAKRLLELADDGLEKVRASALKAGIPESHR